MAEKMVEIYELVTRMAGLEGRMKLAEKTGISRTKAMEMADAPDKLTKLRKEASEILGRDIAELLGPDKR